MDDVKKWIIANTQKYEQLVCHINDQIWQYAELSHEEFLSSKLLINTLKEYGFDVEENICNVKTAFIAKYGNGHPCIGILGEYDALPNLSQEAGFPKKKSIDGKNSGHGCGHCAIGSGSLLTALLLKDYLVENNISGTVVYFGCAAEENAGVKPLMARDGYFDEIDCVFGWHPSTYNGVVNLHHYAVKNFSVEFFGKTAHAGANPHLGRSALDACELMNIGCNYLREHIVPNARIHYAYIDAGGQASNIVQDYCKMVYGVRGLNINEVNEIVERVKKVGEGAALMTETKVKYTLEMGYSDFTQNSIVANILSNAMEEIGAPEFDENDFKLAKDFTLNYDTSNLEILKKTIEERYPTNQWENKYEQPLDTICTPYHSNDPVVINSGSTDVGDVGYVTPTAYMFIATSTLAAPGHSWYMTGMVGSSIGHKSLLNAGKILTLASINVLNQPSLLKGAKEELLNKTNGKYNCPMPK